MLHIIKSVAALSDAVRLCQTQDELLLVEEAVYAAIPQHSAFHQLKKLSVFALKNDLDARGIRHRISPSIKVVDYAGFVELTVKQAKSLTWD
ncbi:sulfurtransferase complex subunit TusB [Vibrio sp. JPW-9-11-11]|uniref:sulfurtransferase complex subunit TusB n=1 Tax=Vibrio sp. JPW-9-11-11 TaxID=1416532 RepID=UPI00159445E8|nr:sulfurtransferase complex subunit TusB [Vibrio sp. JPW-9-11-11]NVD07640.1 sulfurtransferase complex subunit TusB [Vibrio sp. JPW-9-11-11]